MELTQLKTELRRGANASGILLILFYALVYGGTWLLHTLLSQHLEGSRLEDVYGILTYTYQYPVVVPLLLGVFWLICGRKNGQRLRDCFCKPKVKPSTLLRYVLICLGIIYASAYVSRILFMVIQGILGITFETPNMAAGDSVLSMVTNLLAMIIYAPLFEEMLFRGTIFRSMEKGGELAGAILCGILFGLWHTNYDQTIYTAVCGFVTCILFAKTGSIFAPMLLHAMMNSIGALQSLFMGDLDPSQILQLETEAEMLSYMTENIGSFAVLMLSGMVVMALTGTGLILLLIELVQYKQLFRFEKAEISVGEKLKTCLTAPGMLLACVVLLALTVLRAMGIL